MIFLLDQIQSSLLRPEAQNPAAQDRFAVRFPDGTTLATLEKLREGKDPREAAVLGILSEEKEGGEASPRRPLWAALNSSGRR